MKMRSLLFLLLCGLLIAPAAFAQDEATEEEEKTFTISGSIDTYARTTFGVMNPAGTYDGSSLIHAPSTSFANLKGFAIGMANIIASYEGEKVGFVADLVFGPRGTDAVFGSPLYSSTAQTVNQLYAYWMPSDNFTLTLGNFNTFLGYEVISPAVNFHYSTSYMFSWGPFSHTGIKGNLTFGEGMNFMLAVMNPTDVTEFNPVDTYTLGAQLGYSGDAGGIFLNLLYGDQDGTIDASDPDGTESAGSLFQVDVTGGFDLSETFYLGFNATYNQTAVGEFVDGNSVEDLDGDAGSFLGFALYPKLTLSESTAIGLRAEYFAIKNNYLGIIGLDENGDGDVMEFTLSLNKSIGNLTFIPEVRLDMTSENSFVEKDFDGFTDQMISLNFAAVYRF